MRPVRNPEFSFEHGEYWFYRYGVQYFKDGHLDAGHPHHIGKEVAVLIHVGDAKDDSSIYMAKHGSSENVEAYHRKIQESLLSFKDNYGDPIIDSRHLFISGQFTIESLNLLLANASAVKRFLRLNQLEMAVDQDANELTVVASTQSKDDPVKRSMRF